MSNEINIDDFMQTITHLWRAQRNLNITMQSQLDEHYRILKAQNDVLREFRNALTGFQTLLSDHEARLLEIEESLKEETIYMGFSLPKKQ